MKNLWLMLSVCSFTVVGCVDSRDGTDESEATSAVTRPSLSSICSSTCNNSHSQRSCLDQRTSGTVNVSVFPLLEGKTVVPATIIGNPGSWSATSCPNCQWHLVSVTNDRNGSVVTTGIHTATDDINVQRSISGQSDWSGHVNVQIVDPTDASVGVCNLSVGIELINGIIE